MRVKILAGFGKYISRKPVGLSSLIVNCELWNCKKSLVQNDFKLF